MPAEKHWEQFWIDSGGSRAFFTGGWDGKAMVISGKWGGPLVRMSYSKNADGSVRQFGEQSTDEGKTWAPNFDFTYRPRRRDVNRRRAGLRPAWSGDGFRRSRDSARAERRGRCCGRSGEAPKDDAACAAGIAQRAAPPS